MPHSTCTQTRCARLLWLALVALFAWLGAAPAQAQINVDLQIKRRIYMVNEPLLATVIINNVTGDDVMLADTDEGGPWLSFQIVGEQDRLVPPRNPNYEIEPLHIRPGESVKRTLNLNELYTLGDYGSYNVRASIFFAPKGKYYASKNHQIELTEGLRIDNRTVGVPGSDGATRTYTLLKLEEDGKKQLYVRVSGPDDAIIYGCYCLGAILDNYQPDVKLDSGNNLAVLHLVGQRQYILSRIGINGAFLGQTTYITPKSQPYLRKQPNGDLQIVGAARPEVLAAKQAAAGPKLSDRPKGF